MRGREHLCAIRPCGDGILLETLHYADEIREADPLFAGVEDETSDEELLSVATELISRKTAAFDASAYQDRYDAALRDLIEAKRANARTPRAQAGDDAAPRGDNVVDLMAALKDSLKEGEGAKGGGARSRKASGKAGGTGRKGASSGGGRRKTG
jgi:DNA end-binding protein Ku